MGWDNWSNGGRDLTDKKDIEMDLKDKDVGLKEFEVETSTIARGISVGDELEYADEITLGRSILNRIPFENSLKL